MINLKRCDYCKLLLKHVDILQNELTQFELETDCRHSTLLELKSYYWIIKTYYNNVLIQCDCEYKNRFYSILKILLKILENNGLVPNKKKLKCDICKVLPYEVFSLLDNACMISNPKDLESMYVELQYHVFVSWIYEELIGGCLDCDSFVDYRATIEHTCNYLNDKNIHRLREFVYYWKKATNSDRILSCSNALIMREKIKSSEVNLDNHVTVYLDFNVYSQFEKDPKTTEFLTQLSNLDGMTLIYSGTHLEEIMRMNNKVYESKRIQSIQALTHGKIAIVGANDKIVICVDEDISARMKHVEQYRELNLLAEERECIEAEAREYLFLHNNDENRDKAIGNSSIQQIIDNVKDDTGKKLNPNLPDVDDLDRILKYVGIGEKSIKEYKDILKGEQQFHKVRASIVSIAELMNVIGLHGDKIAKKNDANAKYPIYHKKSYRTIRSGYYDNDHLTFASICTFFVTSDSTLYNKAKEIYGYLGIKTIPVLLEEFMSMQNDMLKLI